MKILKTKKYSILSNILKYSFVFMFMFMLITPILFVNAESKAGTGDLAGTGDPAGTGSGTGITSKINNPLGPNISDIPSFIKEIIKIVLYVGVPIVALAIIYTGFLFVEAQGNPEKITKAKKALIYTLIGAALLLGAFVIAEAIKATVGEIKS
jgi:hypothetical protein